MRSVQVLFTSAAPWFFRHPGELCSLPRYYQGRCVDIGDDQIRQRWDLNGEQFSERVIGLVEFKLIVVDVGRHNQVVRTGWY